MALVLRQGSGWGLKQEEHRGLRGDPRGGGDKKGEWQMGVPRGGEGRDVGTGTGWRNNPP